MVTVGISLFLLSAVRSDSADWILCDQAAVCPDLDLEHSDINPCPHRKEIRLTRAITNNIHGDYN